MISTRFPRLSAGLAAMLAILLLPACALLEEPPPPQAHYSPQPMVFRAVGYGTVRPDKGLTVNQMKLMAMRASRMDAYRILTEQVYGIKIAGTTSVGTMVVDNDNYKGYINGYIHGAKLISQQPLTDNYTYETVLELAVDDGFYEFSNRLLSAMAATEPPGGGATHSERHYYYNH